MYNVKNCNYCVQTLLILQYLYYLSIITNIIVEFIHKSIVEQRSGNSCLIMH